MFSFWSTVVINREIKSSLSTLSMTRCASNRESVSIGDIYWWWNQSSTNSIIGSIYLVFIEWFVSLLIRPRWRQDSFMPAFDFRRSCNSNWKRKRWNSRCSAFDWFFFLIKKLRSLLASKPLSLFATELFYSLLTKSPLRKEQCLAAFFSFHQKAYSEHYPILTRRREKKCASTSFSSFVKHRRWKKYISLSSEHRFNEHEHNFLVNSHITRQLTNLYLQSFAVPVTIDHDHLIQMTQLRQAVAFFRHREI